MQQPWRRLTQLHGCIRLTGARLADQKLLILADNALQASRASPEPVGPSQSKQRNLDSVSVTGSSDAASEATAGDAAGGRAVLADLPVHYRVLASHSAYFRQLLLDWSASSGAMAAGCRPLTLAIQPDKLEATIQVRNSVFPYASLRLSMLLERICCINSLIDK